MRQNHWTYLDNCRRNEIITDWVGTKGFKHWSKQIVLDDMPMIELVLYRKNGTKKSTRWEIETCETALAYCNANTTNTSTYLRAASLRQRSPDEAADALFGFNNRNTLPRTRDRKRKNFIRCKCARTQKLSNSTANELRIAHRGTIRNNESFAETPEFNVSSIRCISGESLAKSESHLVHVSPDDESCTETEPPAIGHNARKTW